jgi:hypothetical protein
LLSSGFEVDLSIFMNKHAKRARAQNRARPGQADAHAHACTASELFETLWTTLGEVIGPTATAALLQRSVRRAAAVRPDLQELVFSREQFVHTYAIPSSWSQDDEDALAALRQIVRELWPLLMELTGNVVVQRLRDVPSLAESGVIPKDAAL